MTTTFQRVRELQEQIRASEAKLQELTQQPEYLAEQQFIQDVMDVLEIHSRTLREAVLAIDPSLLGSMPDRQQKPKRTYKPRQPKEEAPEPVSIVPVPKPSPFASFGMAAVAATNPESPQELLNAIEAVAQPSAKPAKDAKAKKTRPSGTHNAARNAKRRLEMIKEGRWFLYTNPHTGETHEAARIVGDVLPLWVAEYGKGVVEGWKRPITPDEAGL
jgi:hypothetical protein